MASHPMRIGLLSQWFSPEHGPASVPGVLARKLAERGHFVSVLTGVPNYPYGAIYSGYRNQLIQKEFRDGVAIYRTYLVPSHNASALGRLGNYASFAMSSALLGIPILPKLDVLWVYNSPISVALPMWASRYFRRTPVVLHVMDVWPESVTAAGFAPSLGATQLETGIAAWCKGMYRSASSVCYISPGAGQVLHDRGVPSGKLHYAPLWADETVYFPRVVKQQERAMLGITENEVVFLYAGSLGKAQDVLSFAEAFARLPREVPARLVVVGAGTQSYEIEAVARQSSGRVIFKSRLTDQQVQQIVDVSDIQFAGFSSTILASMSMPSKVQAIMASGKPLLAFDSGDLASLIRASHGGYLIPALDHRERAITNILIELSLQGRESAAETGKRARQYYLDNFSVEVGIPRIERILSHAAKLR